jgi:prevent-host-death family protein
VFATSGVISMQPLDDSKTIRAVRRHSRSSGKFLTFPTKPRTRREPGRARGERPRAEVRLPFEKVRRCGTVAVCGYTRRMDAAERKRTEQQARAAKTVAERAPITAAELSQRAAEIVKRVHETGEAVVVVQDGQPAAVLVGAEEFALLREHRRFVAAIEEGLADANAGRVLSTQDLMRSLETEFGPIAWQ